MQTAQTVKSSKNYSSDSDVQQADLSKDVEQLREDLKSLKNDIAALAGNAGQQAKAKLRETASTTEEQITKVLEEGSDELQEIQRHAESAVRRKPLTAVAAALAIGYFFAGLTRK